MRILHKVGGGLMIAGLLLFMAAGISIRSDPSGTWFHVTQVHAVAGGLLLCGMLLTVIASCGSGATKAKTEKGQGVDHSA